MGSHVPRELKRLDNIARALAETTSLKDVKEIRDKAEAARHFARGACLGLELQNQAAKVKLQAERRAGQLLEELAPHGGNRKSSCHNGNLNLEALGINSHQSARWRREAAVPEDIFQRYVEHATMAGKEITSQGLLRLERIYFSDRSDCHRRDTVYEERSESAANSLDSSEPSLSELFDELTNHRSLLARILTPICSDDRTPIELATRRHILHLLNECGELIKNLKTRVVRG